MQLAEGSLSQTGHNIESIKKGKYKMIDVNMMLHA